MAFSYTTKTGDGNTTSFTFAFEGQDDGYIREEDIVATVDGAVAPFTLLSSNTLEFVNTPSNGSEIIIRRVMPKNVPYADFQRGNNFGQEVLNNSFLQLLYVVHEILDGWFPEGFTVREAVTFIEGLEVTSPDPNNPDSVVTFSSGDSRYLNVSGDSMQGALDLLSNPIYVRKAVAFNEAVRKQELDAEISARQAADSNLQSQLTGGTPLESSAFSEISWHGQVVENSVTVPENKNAWSFGPDMTIAEGQAVTVPENSTWTVAEGSEPGEVGSVTANAPLVQSGTPSDPILDLPNATVTDDGAMSSEDKTKLDGIESGATADQTDAEIKTAYENNADTNAFTDAEQSKLAGVESGATADQTASEIKTAYESNTNTNAFTDADHTKLDGIEAGAEVNPPAADATTEGLVSTTTQTFAGNKTFNGRIIPLGDAGINPQNNNTAFVSDDPNQFHIQTRVSGNDRFTVEANGRIGRLLGNRLNAGSSQTIPNNVTIVLATASGITLTLPSLTNNDGRMILIRNMTAGSVTIDRPGQSSESIGSGGGSLYITDGTIWFTALTN